MKNKDFINKLKEIKTGQPDSEWVKRNRDILLYQVKAQQSSRFEMFSKDGANYTWSVFRLLFPTSFAYRLTAVVCLMLVLIASSSVTTTWADRSLPGDFLYPVKLTSERVQLAFTFDQESETKLQVEFAGKRLQEVEQISLGDESDVNKADKIKTSLNGYKKNIQQVKNDLEKINKESEPGKAAELASLVSKQVGDYSTVLGNKATVPTSDINEAILASDQVVDKSIDVVLEKYQQVGGTSVPVSPQELAIIFNKKAEIISKFIENIEVTIKAGKDLTASATGENKESVQKEAGDALGKFLVKLETAKNDFNKVKETFASGETITALKDIVNISSTVKDLQGDVYSFVQDLRNKVKVEMPEVKGEEIETGDSKNSQLEDLK
ncbi:MAG: DUF5667 domain-containing protein [Patescibacteria group bacterium]|jgi:gas vesicle protein